MVRFVMGRFGVLQLIWVLLSLVLGVTAGAETISGRVTRQSDGSGAGGIGIRVFDEAWRLVGEATTETSGNYSVNELGPGKYFLQTANEQGLVDEYHPGTAPRGKASAIAVPVGSNVSDINFRLSAWGRISGRVSSGSDDAPIEGVKIGVYNNRWRPLFNTYAGADGRYSAERLGTGSYYLLSANDRGFVDEAYNDVTLSGTEWPPSEALPVQVTIGSETADIDFRLAPGASLSGRVTRRGDGTGIPEVAISLFNRHWQPIRESKTNPRGYFQLSGLVEGTYFLKTTNDLGYIDEYFDEALTETAAGRILLNAAMHAENLDFRLRVGGVVAGRVTDAAGGLGLAEVEVKVYDTQWRFLKSGFSSESGAYAVTGLPAGDCYVRTRNGWNYLDKVFKESLSQADAVSVAVKEAGTTSGIDFSLSRAGSISGRVTGCPDGGGGQTIYVAAFDGSGNFVNGEETDLQGRYTITMLPDGDYFIRATSSMGHAGDYRESDGATRTLIRVKSGKAVSGIDFKVGQAVGDSTASTGQRP
jgi:hypothetical protein